MRIRGARFYIFLLALTVSAGVPAQSLYKYKDQNGAWIYTDRPPDDAADAEVRDLPTGKKPPSVTVSRAFEAGQLVFTAHNDYFAPVEIVLALDELVNVSGPQTDQAMRWLVDPNSEMRLISLPVSGDESEADVKYRYIALFGDPRSRHKPERPYRAPFSIAGSYNVTQAFPYSVTHDSADSRFAVDFAMPVGTDIHAARGGIVFEVASTNFRGGTDPDRDAASANIVRILHDDGTHAVYAHLNWNSIRVKPGDVVERGEYIADSGNTGFSSGPHLHFVVLRNVGMRIESVPIDFEGADAQAVTPQVGRPLTAY
ncbi:MAG: M23 family metallopeptidase [Woeseiaceae bacterium]|nr:M23 family metallopeptidase [Woeseiaceae bacterium]